MLFKTLDPLPIKLYNTITGNAIYYENTSYSENNLKFKQWQQHEDKWIFYSVCQRLNNNEITITRVSSGQKN
jgi:hypothetical protein